jgi:hypothetical protein
MKVPDLFVGKRFFVGEGKPEILGRGPTEVRGSSYVEGPQITGNPSQFNTPNPFELGSTMVGQNANVEMNKPFPFYALIVKTYARIKSFLKVDTLLTVKLIRSKIIYAEVIMAKVKNFSIPHPQKSGINLVYSCLEGPENAVYVRGKLENSNIINLPKVWEDLVDENSITVSITPIQVQQSIVVKEIKDNKVILEAKDELPIHCYYHIFAERKDVSKLVTEVKI